MILGLGDENNQKNLLASFEEVSALVGCVAEISNIRPLNSFLEQKVPRPIRLVWNEEFT